MSLAPLATSKSVPIIDPKFDWQSAENVNIIRGPGQNTWVSLPTQSQSTSSVNFSITPPSPAIGINRQILVSFTFNIAFTGTAGANGKLLAPGTFDAPSMFPIAQITNSLTATINNTTISQNTYRVINALAQYMNKNTFAKDGSLTMAPSMPDVTQNFEDVQNFNLGVVFDPLQKIGQSINQVPPRGGFLNPYGVGVNYDIISNNATTAVVQFTSVEPLFMSPFLNSSGNESMFIGINNMSFQFNLGNLDLVWSHSNHADAGTISSMTVTFPQNQAILMNYITPAIGIKPPLRTSYPLRNITDYSTQDSQTRGPNAVWTMNAQNIQLQNVPKYIYIFAREVDSTTTRSTPHTFANIQAITMNVGNQSGLLAGATTYDLFRMSKDAGYQGNFQNWSLYTGSVLCLEVGKSLALSDPNIAPSLSTNLQIQYTITLKNLNQTRSPTFALYTLCVADGRLTISDLTAVQSNALVSVIDVQKATDEVAKEELTDTKLQVEGEADNNDPMNGGSLLKKIGNIAKKTHAFIKENKLGTHLAAHLGAPPAVTHAITSLGYGASGGASVHKAHLKLRH